MSSISLGLLSIALFLILMFCRMPIGFAMGLIGFVGYSFLVSWDTAFALVGLTMYHTATSYSLSVIPLFVLMGQFAFRSKIADDLFTSVYKWMGHFPGGLAMATIGGCCGFAAVTGSSVTCAITMSEVALPSMRRYDYSPRLALGTIAAGGTLGILIPPSIAFVIYGMLTDQSIGKLLLAGIFPGLLLGLLFIITIYIISRLKPGWAPRGPRFDFKEKMISLKGTWAILLLFFVVIGGIYRGLFTPTEAAAIGAGGALIIALLKRTLSYKEFKDSLFSTAQFSVTIFIVIMGSMILNVFLARSKIPFMLSEVIMGFGLSKYWVLVIIILLYIILGCLMEAYSMIVLTVPIIFPTIVKVGFDPIWYGVLMVILIEMGMITPPVGLNVFVLGGIVKDVPLYDIFMGALPFVIAMAVGIVILIIFPQIALFIPYSIKF